MRKQSLYRLLQLVRDIDIDFDVPVGANTAEHEVERNCGYNDDQHNCDRCYTAAVAVGHCLPPMIVAIPSPRWPTGSLI